MTNDIASPFAAHLGWWGRVDCWLERAGERLNPILVKEARQALKSRQFVITFGLLLICGLGWSLIGVSMLMPGIYYAASGPFMLIGYAVILTVPMLLIVPFSAYRSLAGEREDGTYELLSITTLSSRQIVTGKLGSAVLQMLVYYSALSPCIAFTYLLRGVDIVTLGLILFYTFAASVLLSAVGLLVATLSRARHVQVLLSVALLLGLAFFTLMWCIWTAVFIGERPNMPVDNAEVWIVQGSILTACGSYLVLFLLAAAAQLSFASDNRSTKLRMAMLVQQVLFTGWMGYFWITYHWDLSSLLAFSGGHWMLMGALLTGEWSVLSPRVKRQLPQSVLGRVFLTWFNPGSGTGYVFAVVNLVAVTVLACMMALAAQGFNRWPVDVEETVLFGVLLCAYVAAYLGVGRLIALWLRRYLYFGLLLPLVVHALLLALGVAVPSFLQAWLFGFAEFEDYSVLQAPNWAWTLVEVVDGRILADPAVPILVVASAVVIFLVNLAVAAKEVEQERETAPERVVLDELQLHPERAAEKKPSSPFED
jgi:ABC-type transport system involved in multi-copper enzyme maturation permease subunit